MAVLEKVGIKITEGAKAFLYKEYIWLTIWSVSFAIVIGSTVDLLEMQMPRAPINFPFTATAYLTGSMTSILAGYIGMRIAVYTNTRVTFTCCTSVHKGFVTAFRGGQVLGFVLVGLGVLNIMIIILLFKACWYNTYLDQAVAAGVPVDHCPHGNDVAGTTTKGELATHISQRGGFTWAQDQIWIRFEQIQQASWVASFNNYYSNDAAGKTALGKAAEDLDTYFRASSVYWEGKTPVTTTGTVTKVAETEVECLGTTGHADATQLHSVWDKSSHSCTLMVQKSICDLWTAATTTLKATAKTT
jgi:inorganic pyrophosphatase